VTTNPISAKFLRAVEHAAAFQRSIDAYFATHSYSVTCAREDERWFVLRWRTPAEAPDLVHLALVYGDMLSNLRATLDYLVWQLVLESGNTPHTRNMFPCVADASTWETVASDRLRGLSDQWRNEIRVWQPFIDPHRTGRPDRDLLAVLDKVNNINKHRVLSASIVRLDAASWDADYEPGTRVETIETIGPAADGVEMLRIRSIDPNARFEVTGASVERLWVAFDDGLDHLDGWTYSNDDLIERVRHVISMYEPAAGRILGPWPRRDDSGS
jgi:hypothetical protein